MPHQAARHRAKMKMLKKKQQKTLIRRAVLATAVIEPAMTLPQIYDIWSTHTAAGVSKLTWSMYVGAAAVWLLYGIQEKDKPIIVSSILWIVAEVAVVIGAVLYS
jgi:uncharacterized protein with PQ loop repeat